MRTQGLTATIIFEARSLNYDEGYGNLSIVKKLYRGNGNVYSYSSRQSIRYSIFMQGYREHGWCPSEVELAGSGDKKVTQLISKINESEESDLFGYMRTNVKVGKKQNEVSVMRTAPVRLLPAISLEPFANDMEMLTNKYQADKIQAQPNIANMEIHNSLYRYTVAIDLHRIGTEADVIGTRVSPSDEKFKDDEEFKKFEHDLRNLNIDYDKRTRRIQQFLDIIGTLYRDIRGRREDLKPLFIIGGMYDLCNPFFENLVRVDWLKGKPKIIVEPLQQLLMNNDIASKTYIGIRDGIFVNSKEEFEKVPKAGFGSPEFVIQKLKEKVKSYYESEKENTEKKENS